MLSLLQVLSLLRRGRYHSCPHTWKLTRQQWLHYHLSQAERRTLMAVLALAEAFVRGSEAESLGAAPQLAAALAKAAASAGKENSSARETLQAAQQCFKAAQQRLAQAQGDGDDRRSLAQLVAVGRASLAAVAALTPAGNTQQLAGLRYNFARRLVSCKAFADAQTEAWLLFQQLGKQAAAAGGGSRRAAASAAAADEAANMMVGTALTLVLCCVEGKLFDDAQAMQGLLQAADILPTWLRCGHRPCAAGHIACSDPGGIWCFKHSV